MMPPLDDIRENEVAFCAEVASWLNQLFAQRQDLPFGLARIEQYGKGTAKRSDLRIYPRQTTQAPVLTGEVKLPGTPEGRTPYNDDLIQDAAQKADNLSCRYFFTWNVNTFVLFDRQKWKEAPWERRVKEWETGLNLESPADIAREDVKTRLREKFLPQLFQEFAEIYHERIPDWGMPPDQLFIRNLEGHLSWPVFSLRDYLSAASQTDRTFDTQLQAWMAGEMEWTFSRDDPAQWRYALDRAARTLCYVFCNRVVFYEAIRARFSQLPELRMPAGMKDYREVYIHFNRRFQEACDVTGDYEPIFYPTARDWAGPYVFAPADARDAWRSVLRGVESFNFRQLPYDIIGKIFKRLISPEERHQYGQHFTGEDIVDVINAFCIRRAGDVALDPACGSASFLVRAYCRKGWLSEQPSAGKRHQDPHKRHDELLQEIFGCDIALFPAHLATLNLAARSITHEKNYPNIARRNFFDVEPGKPFCYMPGPRVEGRLRSEPIGIELPSLDAIVGNPPYVRQELIPRSSAVRLMPGETPEQYRARLAQTKEHLQQLMLQAWPNLQLSGRSDLHCYFWPAACRFLKEGGYFGFLTSSGWLDADYGFRLQAWILRNFKLIAIMESLDEPWFEDARIKTCVTILQRCRDPKERDQNLVKFVRFNRPLAEILGDRPPGDEAARQNAAEALRRRIESAKTDRRGDDLRIIVIPQLQLWEQGVKAGKILARANLPDTENSEDDEEGQRPVVKETEARYLAEYVAGKWGRYLRAPDFYFDVMRELGHRFVPMGEIAEIRFGVKSGCDAFFMPHDVSQKLLEEYPNDLAWSKVPMIHGCHRRDVKSGKLKIIRAGDGSLHPIEAEYLAPEVHSLMEVQRPVIHAKEVDRVVLLVNKSLIDLRGTFVARYIRWGAKQPFQSRKSKAVPIPERPTCVSRPLWYDLTGSKPGEAFWPKSQQYRHVIPANPEGLICNCNLYDLHPRELPTQIAAMMPALLNSTLVALWKVFYGRYAGTEGNLKTEIVDVNLLEIPDIRVTTPDVIKKISKAFTSLQQRTSGHLVEQDFLDCHSVETVRVLARNPLELPDELQQSDRRALDDAVFELLGEADPERRKQLVDKLYEETARHYRQIRIVEVQKMVQRRGSPQNNFGHADIAEEIWAGLESAFKKPLSQWVAERAKPGYAVTIPEGKARFPGEADFFDRDAVFFGTGKDAVKIKFPSPAHAGLAARLAELEIRGSVALPLEPEAARRLLAALNDHLSKAQHRFGEITAHRTGNERLRSKVSDLLLQWFIHGRHSAETEK